MKRLNLLLILMLLLTPMVLADSLQNVTVRGYLNVGTTNLTTDQITQGTNKYYVSSTVATDLQNTTIARTGNCGVNTVVQNITTSGVQCVTDQTSAGGGYATIMDEATTLTQRTKLNFTGAGVSCVDGNTDQTICTITSGGGNPFNQVLNTTSNVNFSTMIINNSISLSNTDTTSATIATLNNINYDLSIQGSSFSNENISRDAGYAIFFPGNVVGGGIVEIRGGLDYVLSAGAEQDVESLLGGKVIIAGGDAQSGGTGASIELRGASWDNGTQLFTNGKMILAGNSVEVDSHLTANSLNVSGNIYEAASRVCTVANGLCGVLSLSDIVTNIGNFSANGYNKTYINTLGNASAVNTSTNIKVLGFNTTVELQSVFYNKTYVNTLGNASAVNTTANIQVLGFNTTIQLQSVFYNKTYVDTLGNASKHVANCGAGTVIQNITATGIQCVTDQTSAGGGYATIYDEATALTQRTKVNFTGAGVSCVDDATNLATICTIPGGSGSPGGSSGQVQYNNAGSFDGVANVSVVGGNLFFNSTTEPAFSNNSGVTIYSTDRGTENLLAFKGKAGYDKYVQPHWAYEDVAIYQPAHTASATTAPICIGCTATAAVGTVGNPVLSPTTFRGTMVWTTITSAAGLSDLKGTGVNWMRGNDSILIQNGGFKNVQRFSYFGSTLNMSSCFGMTGSASAMTNASNCYLSTLATNNIFVGQNQSQLYLGIWSNDASGLPTRKLDCGINYPAGNNTNITGAVYESTIFARPADGGINSTTVGVYVKRLDNASIAPCQYELTTDIPAQGVTLTWRQWAWSGPASLATGAVIGMNKVYTSRDN